MTVYFWDWEYGNDDNDGLTPETAVLTEARMWELFAQGVNREGADVVFEIGPDAEPTPTQPALFDKT